MGSYMSATTWTQAPTTLNPTLITQLLPLNDSEFIAMGSNYDAIFKYNKISNKWTKIIKFPDNYLTNYHISTIDTKNNNIYTFTADNKLIIFNLNTKSIVYTTSVDVTNFRRPFHEIFFYNQELHYFTPNQHLVYNGSGFETVVNVRNNKKISTWVAKVMGNKLITTMSGIGDDLTQTKIIQYKNDKWRNTKIANCENVFCSTIVETTKGDYWIFLGGLDVNTNKPHNLIHVYDVKRNRLNRSSINLPSSWTQKGIKLLTYSCDPMGLSAAMCPIIMRNNRNDKFLTYGFIRNCYKDQSFQNLQQMPRYLLDYIFHWVWMETMHLIWFVDHWIIDVDIIVNAVTYD